MINSRTKFIQTFDGSGESLGIRLDILDNITLFKTRSSIKNLMKFLSACRVKFINIGSIFSCIYDKQISSFAIDPRLLTPAVIGGNFNIEDSAEAVLQFFINNKTNDLRAEFSNFCEKNRHWLENYAAFCAIYQQTSTNDFSKWPEILREYKRRHVEIAKKQLANEVFLHKILQFFLHKQLQLIKFEANAENIFLCGDCDILCEHLSSDVWSCQKLFFVDPLSKATIFAGLPPSKKFKDGIKTTKVPYRVAHLKNTNYEFFENMFAHLQAMFDAVFLINGHSIFQFWEIAQHECDPKHGRWVNLSTDKLFQYLDTNFNNFPYLFDFNEPLFADNEVISKRHRMLQVAIDGEPTTHQNKYYNLSRKLFAISSSLCDRKFGKLPALESTLAANTESCIKNFNTNKYHLCILHFAEILNLAKCSADDISSNLSEYSDRFVEKLQTLMHRNIKRKAPAIAKKTIQLQRKKNEMTFWQKIVNFFRNLTK